MVQVQKNFEGLLNDGMGLPAFDIDDEAYAAGFMLELGVVKTLFSRRSSPRNPIDFAFDSLHF